MMQMLRMISGLVFMVRPARAVSRLLVRTFVAIVNGGRPTTATMRFLYVLFGIFLLLGAWGAERGGHRGCAIAAAIAGATLLVLRRKAPLVGEPRNPKGPQMPSDLLRAGWVRKGVAANGRGEPALSDDPAAAAWSLCGAVNAVYEPDSPAWRSYMAALRAQVGRNIIRWNGDESRTQEEVIAVALEAEKIVKAPRDET